jgi:hypothetical protein
MTYWNPSIAAAALRVGPAALLLMIAVTGCGGGGPADTADDAASPAAIGPGAASGRPQEVAEVAYRITGAYDESHDESGNVMCSITEDGRLLAQSFQGGEDRWGLSLEVEATEPGSYEASLRLGPPRDRAELWEGRQVDEPGGHARGVVDLVDSREEDGWGHRVMTIRFDFPEVELQRSGQVVGLEGEFRCGLVVQSG